MIIIQIFYRWKKKEERKGRKNDASYVCYWSWLCMINKWFQVQEILYEAPTWLRLKYNPDAAGIQFYFHFLNLFFIFLIKMKLISHIIILIQFLFWGFMQLKLNDFLSHLKGNIFCRISRAADPLVHNPRKRRIVEANKMISWAIRKVLRATKANNLVNKCARRLLWNDRVDRPRNPILWFE